MDDLTHIPRSRQGDYTEDMAAQRELVERGSG